MQDDLQGLSVCCHHNELRDASVGGFGGFIGSFPKLLVVTWLLNKVQQLLGEVGICTGTGLWIHISLGNGHHALASPWLENSPPQTDWNAEQEKEQKSLLIFTFLMPRFGQEIIQFLLHAENMVCGNWILRVFGYLLVFVVLGTGIFSTLFPKATYWFMPLHYLNNNPEVGFFVVDNIPLCWVFWLHGSYTTYFVLANTEK